MKLLSLNIDFYRDNSQEILDFISKISPDFICLQEVSNSTVSEVSKKFKAKSLFDEKLSDEYEFNLWCPFSETSREKRGEEFEEFGGLVQQGIYFLSKYPINLGENIFYYLNYKQVPFWEKKHFQTGRAFQSIIVEIEGKSLQIINNHGIIREERKGNSETNNETELIYIVAQEFEYPKIIVGDFNLLPESKSLEILNKNFENLMIENGIMTTRPAPKEMTVDYIFVKDLKINKFEVIESNISDHFPIILDFDLQ